MRILLLVIFLSFANLVSAEDSNSLKSDVLARALLSMQNIKGGELQFTVRNKRFSRDDTITYKVHQIFSVPHERPDSRQYKFLIHFPNVYFAYDGRSFLKEYSGKPQFNPPDWGKIYFDINPQNYIIPSFEQFIHRISSLLFNARSTVTEHDTVLNEREVKMVNISIPYPFKGDSFTTRYEVSVYISKIDHIPLKFHSVTSHASLGDFYTEMMLEEYTLSETFDYLLDQMIDEKIRLAKEEVPVVKDSLIATENTPETLQAGDPVPAVKFYDFNNRNTGIAMDSNLTLVYFWYLRCYPCLLSQPDLKKLHENYSHQGLKIIAVNVTDTMNEHMQKYLSVYQPPYIQATAEKTILKSYRVNVFPTFYLVKNGKVIYSRTGYSPDFYSRVQEAIIANF